MALYRIDLANSTIRFKVKQLMISTVLGSFDNFKATMETYREDFSDAVIKFECDVSSISTNIRDRDNHLKSADFFDVENYPKITFESTQVKRLKTSYLIYGNLIIKGISHEIELGCKYFGSRVDDYGQTKLGFEIEGSINRDEYDLAFNPIGLKGSGLIGHEIKIEVRAEMLAAELILK
jgi:polyisoprenoid-binding protein YceI